MSAYSSIDNLLSLPPFEKNADQKSVLFKEAIYEAFKHHFRNNLLFRNFCQKNNFIPDSRPANLDEYPYLSVNVFKNNELRSVSENEIKTVLSSSATSGIPSFISIDGITAKRQTLVSAKVMADYLGGYRRPFLILDEDPNKEKAAKLSARSAATRGFLILAERAEYFLNNIEGQLVPDLENFESMLRFFEKEGREVCIFGFTYILYTNFVKPLKEHGISFNLSRRSKVAHIGGWKKLASQQVSRKMFLEDLCVVFGVKETEVFDFYGFTEQMGLIYGNRGLYPKTVPLYSEIIIRDPLTLNMAKDGDSGLIQILTPLPHSYPGISVLTEDIGRIVGRGEDAFGRRGTQFELIGRAEKAESRGCGDILAESINQKKV